jgi:outer membrane protein assembly factor BamA
VPAISFSSDLGFQYGASVNFYHYGDGSRFPAYNHSLYIEVSRYTKGSGIYRFYYDSDQLIKGILVMADLSYLPERAYDFYGFNGYESVFNMAWHDDSSPEYRTRMFYKFQQNNFRFKSDFQGKLRGAKFNWVLGFNMQNFALSSVDIHKLNKGKDAKDKLPSITEQPGLYEKYQQWGLISPDEANGGFVPELKAGIVFDTRDNRPNPMNGVWTEVALSVAPDFLGAESTFSKFAITHRQYFTLIKDDLSFAYRVGWQETIGGNVPFYYQPQIITSVMTGATNTGLGGSKYLRGAQRNRVVGDGIVYGNLELRWKFARMNLMNQNFYWGLNGFLDFGKVTKKIDLEKRLSSVAEPIENYFKFNAEKMHTTAGAGIRLAMNYNFIIAIDYGLTLNGQDGRSGLYMGLNYIF